MPSATTRCLPRRDYRSTGIRHASGLEAQVKPEADCLMVGSLDLILPSRVMFHLGPTQSHFCGQVRDSAQ